MATRLAIAPPAGPVLPRLRSALWLPIALTFVLTLAWTVQHWPALSVGRLPDTDDAMRLAQIRDWIGGQALVDVTQYRLGDGGVAMHWSRLGDVGPAALILLLAPLLGTAGAELAAVIAWPALLFLALLLIVRRIAIDLEGPDIAPVATVLAALSYPTAAFFMPGRIDHHGLQAVLLCAVVAAMTAPAGRRTGLAAGVASGLSLALGLEAAPLLLAAMAALGLAWIEGGADEDDRVQGFAAGLAVTLVGAMLALSSTSGAGWCDALTPAATIVLLLMVGGWCVIATAGRRVPNGVPRAGLAFGTAAVAGGIAAFAAPVCFTGPYGPVDPLLMRLWMANVAEAGPLFGSGGVGLAIAQGGLIVAGVVAAAIRLRADPDGRRRWRPLCIVLAAGAIGMVFQIRLTYLAAILAVPALAWLIVRARLGKAPIGLPAAWIAATGITYAVAGQWLATAGRSEPAIGVSCTSAAAVRAAAGLPQGLIAAPMDAGAYLIGMTHHRVLAAPYHRNNGGNLLLYRLLLAPPEQARAMAAAAGIDHLMLCSANVAELKAEAAWPASLAAALLSDADPPDWVAPAPAPGGVVLFTVRPAAPSADRTTDRQN